MSLTTARSAVFLDEMGVGAQWKLRNPPVAEQVELAESAPEAFAAPAIDERQAETRLAQQDVRAEPTRGDVVAPAPAPIASPAPVAASAVPVATPTPAPAYAPPLSAAEPVASTEEDSTSWFDEAPAPPRAEPVSDEAIAVMDWDTLRTAVSTCTRCSLCETRRNAVNGRGAGQASWIAIAAAPSRLDEKENQAVAGEAGQLLDNMLKAIAVKPETDLYITNLVKCRPSTADGAERAPSGEELLACRPYLQRELALTGATMAITFGQYAAKGLMMGPAARGKVMRYGAAELPVVATYHPDDLLRRPEDKAKAWGDLCLAKAARD